MVTDEMVQEMVQGKRKAFIFTFGGMVQSGKRITELASLSPHLGRLPTLWRLS